MEWWQLIIAILGSGTVTAFITGGFNCFSNKQQNEYNQKRFDNEREVNREKEEKEKNIEKAKDLFRIINQGLDCEYVVRIIKEPNKYVREAWPNLKLRTYGKFVDPKFGKLMNYLKEQGEIIREENKEDNEIPVYDYFYELLKNDLFKNIKDFELKYFKYEKNDFRRITVDIEKLNKDISFVNKWLDKNIEI